MILVCVLCMADKLDTVTIQIFQFVLDAGVPKTVVKQFIEPVSIASFRFIRKQIITTVNEIFDLDSSRLIRVIRV